jgi:hypothetical protein
LKFLYDLTNKYPSTRLIAIDESIKLNLLPSVESVKELINYSSNGSRNIPYALSTLDIRQGIVVTDQEGFQQLRIGRKPRITYIIKYPVKIEKISVKYLQ